MTTTAKYGGDNPSILPEPSSREDGSSLNKISWNRCPASFIRKSASAPGVPTDQPVKQQLQNKLFLLYSYLILKKEKKMSPCDGENELNWQVLYFTSDIYWIRRSSDTVPNIFNAKSGFYTDQSSTTEYWSASVSPDNINRWTFQRCRQFSGIILLQERSRM